MPRTAWDAPGCRQVVEMEDRCDERGCRADLCATGTRPARSLYSDYTFAVWSEPPEHPDRVLVPFAKAYSGLTDAEMAQVDSIIRKTTRESFGPVRSVEPTLLFELGFEGISGAAAIKAASRCAFRECCAGARISRSPKRIRCRRWRRCSRTEAEHCRLAEQIIQVGSVGQNKLQLSA